MSFAINIMNVVEDSHLGQLDRCLLLVLENHILENIVFRTHDLNSNKIIEAHGGRIWTENNTDQPGATFYFSSPLSQSAYGFGKDAVPRS
jgi:hypothetical protein